MDEMTRKQIEQVRTVAEQMGHAALEAIGRGDIGMARNRARQAAQYARVAIELETGERLDEPEAEESVARQTTLSV